MSKFNLDKAVTDIVKYQQIEIKRRKIMSEPKTTYIKDKAPTLEELQEMVGGYIEVVHAKNGDQIILDEEGRLKGKPINEDASEHWLGDKWDNDYSNVLGDVVILSGKARLE